MTTVVPKQTGMNQQKFEELFRKYRQLVYRAAYTVTGRRQDAEDALQTLFLRLLDQGFSLELIRNPEGYLYRTAVNEARQMFRARKRRNHMTIFKKGIDLFTVLITDAEDGVKKAIAAKNKQREEMIKAPT